MVFPKTSDARICNDNECAAAQWDYCFNKFFPEAIIEGKKNDDLTLNSPNVTIRDDWKSKLYFIGINYYCSVYIKSVYPIGDPWYDGIFDEDLAKSISDKNHGLNDLDWEIYLEVSTNS